MLKNILVFTVIDVLLMKTRTVGFFFLILETWVVLPIRGVLI